MSQCRSCGAEIMWVKTAKGKNMPIDFDKDLVLQKDELFDRDRMTSHFDTCPQAEKHRS